MYGIAYILYYSTNHYPQFEPKELNLTWLDQNTPFMPYSVLIYISEYIYFAFVYILLKKHIVINRYLYSFISLQTISCLIFLFAPTIYPRENFPISKDLPEWLQAVWTWLRIQDAPTNCFPSLHVSSVYLSAFVFWDDEQKGKFWFFVLWGTCIAATTLTTKQHYVADIIAGLGFALFTYWWFHRRRDGLR